MAAGRAQSDGRLGQQERAAGLSQIVGDEHDLLAVGAGERMP
jgi:hypothetical protein